MGLQIPNPPAGFDDLSPNEKIAYVQSLWDRVAANPAAVPVPDWHREIIEQRLAAGDEQPSRPWDEIREELRSKLRSGK